MSSYKHTVIALFTTTMLFRLKKHFCLLMQCLYHLKYVLSLCNPFVSLLQSALYFRLCLLDQKCPLIELGMSLRLIGVA